MFKPGTVARIILIEIPITAAIMVVLGHMVLTVLGG